MTNLLTGNTGTIEDIVDDLFCYELKLTGDRMKDATIETIEGCDQDAYNCGAGTDTGNGYPDDVEIISKRPATITDYDRINQEDRDHAYMYVTCIAEE